MTSFISGAVPAVALWVPFNIPVREKVPGAKMLTDASAYYPKAAIVGGWAARNDYYGKNRAVCANIIAAGRRRTTTSSPTPTPRSRRCRRTTTSRCRSADLKEQFKAQKMFTSKDWKKLYADGTVTQVAAAGDRLLRALRRHPEPGARVASTSTPKLYLETLPG